MDQRSWPPAAVVVPVSRPLSNRQILSDIQKLIDRRRLVRLQDVVVEIGITPDQAIKCLRRLRKLDAIHCVAECGVLVIKMQDVIYAAGSAPAEGAGEGMPVALSFQHWPRGHARRDPLVAALFGPSGPSCDMT